jgi:hypothetical protein
MPDLLKYDIHCPESNSLNSVDGRCGLLHWQGKTKAGGDPDVISSGHEFQNGIPSATMPMSSAPASSFVEARFEPDFLPGLDEVGFGLSTISAPSSA